MSDATVANKLFVDAIVSGNRKYAQDVLTEFTRTKQREDLITSSILTPQRIDWPDLDRQADTELPVKVIDKEPDSPGAASVPLATLPENWWLEGKRYRVLFNRIVTPRAVADVGELRTWTMDIRDVISNNLVLDMAVEIDSKFIGTVNRIVGPTAGAPGPAGYVLYQQYTGVTRNNVPEAYKILESTPYQLTTSKILVHRSLLHDLEKLDRLAIGDDTAGQLFYDGWTRDRLGGYQLISTIKNNVVPANTMYLFADEKFLGKYFELEPVTMFVEAKAYLVEFFAWQMPGISIGHVAACARVDFV